MTEPTTEQVAEVYVSTGDVLAAATAVQALYAPVLAGRVTHDRLAAALHKVRDPREHSPGDADECLYCPELAHDLLAALAESDGKGEQ